MHGKGFTKLKVITSKTDKTGKYLARLRKKKKRDKLPVSKMKKILQRHYELICVKTVPSFDRMHSSLAKCNSPKVRVLNRKPNIPTNI